MVLTNGFRTWNVRYIQNGVVTPCISVQARCTTRKNMFCCLDLATKVIIIIIIIIIIIPNDMNIVSKRIEKIEKYANLSIELKELWGAGMKTVETIPLVIGCTGTVDKKFVDKVDKFPVQLSIGELQKITILGTSL